MTVSVYSTEQIDALLAGLPSGGQGPQGPAGPPGPQGPQGPASGGASGLFPVQGGSELDIQLAINNASLAGGGDVLLENTTYQIDNGLVVPSANIRLRGQGGSILQARNATGNLLTAAGTLSGFLTMAADTPQWATSIRLSGTGQFTVGEHILIQKLVTFNGAGVYYAHIAQIIDVTPGVDDTIVSFYPAIPYTVLLSETNRWIRTMVNIPGLVVEGITFVGSGNHNLIGQRGMQYRFTRDAILRDLSFHDFKGAAALYAGFSFGMTIDGITAHNSASQAESDVHMVGHTALTARNILSQKAYLFGPQFVQCTYLQADQIHSFGAGARGIKFNAVLVSNVSNLIGNNSQSTGIAISLGTKMNNFSNLVAIGNKGFVGNEVGLWFSDQHNQNNFVSGLVALGNGGSDIAVFPTDTGNVIRGARYDTIYNGGNAQVLGN